MRPIHRHSSPLVVSESAFRSAGLSGARALTRLIVLLLENLGSRDRSRVRSALDRQDGAIERGGRIDPSMLSAEIRGLWHSLPEAYAAAGLGTLTEPAAEHPSCYEATASLAPERPQAPDQAAPAPVATEAYPAVPLPAAHAATDYGSGFAALTQPMWRIPFVALPGVRYVRTPDSLLRRGAAPEAPITPLAPAEPASTDLAPADLASPDPALPDFAAPECLPDAPPEPVASADVAPPAHRLRLVSGYAIDLPAPANDEPLPVCLPTQPEGLVAQDGPVASEEAALPAPVAEPAVPLPPEIEARQIAQAFAVVVRPKAERHAAAIVEATPAVTLNVRRPREITWSYPPVALLAEPRKPEGVAITTDALEQNARLLESVLEDFGIRGEIIHVRAGPVVTLYELEPAPGMKSSRVIGLADDIARSMSALSARVAVVPGRNAIGIELPNERRETVYFRELVDSDSFRSTQHRLALCLGKTIGGENVIAELAKMPHLLVAGTTGSGKSVAINTMILSLLYRLRPDECRLIMVDPKMLELSVYDGIPHLLTPVVTDPKKAVVALKWAVREMEDRYKKMSKLGVRNIEGFNLRVRQAKEAGETITVGVTTGYDKETGKPITGEEALDLTPLPFIVVIVDEMADLMMVAGKDIEGAIQRLAQMARAAGIHLIMATQRPSVDVITGTIKANFPTRISFQVTSKIDSRTILGEQGAEQLLGQGDMLHMQGGGRIYRVHGPFVSDDEVEKVVAHLKAQGQPDYLDSVTDEVEPETGAAEPDAEADVAVFDKGAIAAEDGQELYDQAVRIVLRDKKCSVSYVQRRLQVGYNRAASLIERMEKEGVLGPANSTGKREILAHSRARVIHGVGDEDGDV